MLVLIKNYCLKHKPYWLIGLLLLSCVSENINNEIIGNWKVIKKEKYVKIMTDRYAPVEIEIQSNESYSFSDEKVVVKTYIGSTYSGNWQIIDSTLQIELLNETKKFKIGKIKGDSLVLKIDDLKLTLKKE